MQQPVAADTSDELHCDVLVVGAGPAGSACARWLSQRNQRVVLADAQIFPRDKTCGDALIPDALAALERLGVHSQVTQHAQAVNMARCVAPRCGEVQVPGVMAVLPRRELDALLVNSAVESGTHLLTPWKLISLLEDKGRVCGARLAHQGQIKTIHAKWVVLATGAALAPLLACGMCEQRQPDYMALRGYVRMRGLPEKFRQLQFFWHPALCGGYGWIFPAGQDSYNIGVGVETKLLKNRNKQEEPNLRELFDRFVEVSEEARQLKNQGEWIGELKGAPMRSNLAGSLWSRPGLLAAGEAAGSTYAFTGEGIGKALETGIACAEAILSGKDDAAVMALQRSAYEALLPRYTLYRKAQHFNRWPWMIDLAVWKARRSPRIVKALSDVLHERRLPGTLLSWRGLRALLFY